MARRDRLTSEALLERVVALSREKRGEDVAALDVRGLVEYMDYLVLVSARSDRQNRAIADHLVASLRREGVRPLSAGGYEGGAWVCLDFVDVVVHLFTPETRRHYDLELLWGDAPRVALPAPQATSDAEAASSARA